MRSVVFVGQWFSFFLLVFALNVRDVRWRRKYEEIGHEEERKFVEREEKDEANLFKKKKKKGKGGEEEKSVKSQEHRCTCTGIQI